MFPKTKWVYPDNSTIPDSILQLADGNPLVAAIYQHYGIQSAEDLQNRKTDIEQSTSPFELPDIEKAVLRILAAINNKERIAIWGDFDADGQTSTSILVGTLRELKADVIFHIPVRGPESHGINMPNLQKLFRQDIKILLTCDTGIREFDAAQACKNAGVDMIISDHHTPAEQIPDAFAVISGQLLSEEHPLHDLCGAGCAYKLSEALFIRSDQVNKKDMFIDLAAIGTIADLVPLNLENRRIVRKGLSAIRSNPRPAIAELLKIAQIEAHMLQEEHIGFQIAPRMNALGRLADANDIVPFFLSSDPVEIRITASRLDGLNLQRKQLCDNVYRAAEEAIQRDTDLLKSQVLVLHHPSWPAGINGLVASQLTERYHKPSIVLTAPPGENARGSARSIEGINITEAIESQASLLSSFGGHAMAAGLSLPQDNLPAFRKGISSYVSNLTAGMDITAKTYISLQTDFADLTLEAFEKMECFSPFGPENPAPVFLTKNVRVNNVISLTKEKQHLKLECQDENEDGFIIFWWNADETQLQKETQLDILYHARPTIFRGTISIQCTLLDFQVHTEHIEAGKPKEIQIIDRRQFQLSDAWLNTYLKSPNKILWAEGKHPFRNAALNRDILINADTLLLGTTPHSFNLIQQIIKKVQPKTVIITGNYAEQMKFDQFLTTCVGLLKFAVKHKNGKIPISVFELQTGERPETIKTAILLLQSQGIFKIINITDEEVTISIPKCKNNYNSDELKNILVQQRKETMAFRKYIQSIPVEVLSEIINE